MSHSTNEVRRAEADHGLFYTVVRHLVLTAVYTPIHYAGLSVVCIFWIVAAIQTGGEMAGLVYLVILSWSVLFGQVEALDLVSEIEREWSKLTEGLVVVAGALYYNLMVLLTLVAALVVGDLVSLSLIAAVALLLPAGDIMISRKFDRGIAILILGGAIRIGEWLTETYEKIPFEHLALSIIEMAEAISEAIPPILRHLSLENVRTQRRQL